MHEPDAHHKRSMLRKASTIGTPLAKKLVRWVVMRCVHLPASQQRLCIMLLSQDHRTRFCRWTSSVATGPELDKRWHIGRWLGMRNEGLQPVEYTQQTRNSRCVNLRLKTSYVKDVRSDCLGNGSKNSAKDNYVDVSSSLLLNRMSLSPSQSALNLKQLRDHPNKKQAAKKIPRVLSVVTFQSSYCQVCNSAQAESCKFAEQRSAERAGWRSADTDSRRRSVRGGKAADAAAAAVPPAATARADVCRKNEARQGHSSARASVHPRAY